MDKKWKKVQEKIIYSQGFVQLKEELCNHTQKEIQHRFFRMEFLDWVNIVPITAQNEVVLVNQYRFGTEEVTLEVPGGTLDEGENQPSLAGQRELLEETGYQAEEIISLGQVAVNPAIQNNYCHFYLAPEVTKIQEQNLDATEDISLELIPIEEVSSLLQAGEIEHSLSVLALLYAQSYLGV
ncbi:NUDIX hydrolase [Halanaerobaculum tunisiense]